MQRLLRLIACSLGVVVAAVPLQAQRRGDTTRLEDEAVRRMVEYLRINTTNPPGNEDQAMQFFARIFTQEGIAFDTASSAPGRGNIWARLKGGSAPALVLLHHMDVVPADQRYWRLDPFAASVQDSDIYARAEHPARFLVRCGHGIDPALPGLSTIIDRLIDLSLFKTVTLSSNVRLQLRAEMFNLTNTPSFANPNAAFGTAGFGSITSTGGAIPFQTQFAVKLLF